MTSQRMDKSIYEKQSDPLIIQCFYAQHEKYSQAKMIAGGYFVICVILVCIFTVLSALIDNEIISGISIILSIVSGLVLYPVNNWISKFKKDAAEIQQYIDVTLYSSEEYSHIKNVWNCPLTKSQIIEKVSTYLQSGFTPNDKWYEDYSDRNYREQIILCQKENIRWDSELREKYTYAYYGVMVLAIVMIVIAGIIISPTFMEVISIISWCNPFVNYLLSFNKHMKEDLERVKELNLQADSVENDNGAIGGDYMIIRESRLQNDIFDLHDSIHPHHPTFLLVVHCIQDLKFSYLLLQ